MYRGFSSHLVDIALCIILLLEWCDLESGVQNRHPWPSAKLGWSQAMLLNMPPAGHGVAHLQSRCHRVKRRYTAQAAPNARFAIVARLPQVGRNGIMFYCYRGARGENPSVSRFGENRPSGRGKSLSIRVLSLSGQGQTGAGRPLQGPCGEPFHSVEYFPNGVAALWFTCVVFSFSNSV